MRVENFPAPAPKCRPPNSSSPAAAAPPMPRSRSRGSAARVAFAGAARRRMTMRSANRIVGDLEREGIDCSGAVRVAGAHRLGIADPARRGGREDDRHAPRRRGSSHCPPPMPQAGGRCRRGAGRQPLSGISSCRCARAARRATFRVVHRSRSSGAAGRSAAGAGTHVICVGRSAARQHRACTTSAPACSKLGEHFKGFLAVTDGPTASIGSNAASVRHMAAFKVEGDRYARRRRYVSRRLHACAGGRPAMSSTRCALPAPRRRSNARDSAALTGAATRAEVDEFLKKHPA